MKKRCVFLSVLLVCICILASCGNESKLIGEWNCYAAEKNGERYNASDVGESLEMEFIDSESLKQIANGKVENFEYSVSDNVITLTQDGQETKYKYEIREVSDEKLVLYYQRKKRLLYFKKAS
ncbi:MAG: lipocalin family protein [Ruminococcus sp.]|nr:lipocalin family protein [Ruminococcus sp.]